MLLSVPRARNFCLVTALLFLISSFAWTQANVNEGLETASIYVDASHGNDNNNGAKATPLKTIQAAVKMATSNNEAGVGTRVVINPGTYRESVMLINTRRSTSKPMTFEAATNGTVVVSGADTISSWTPYKGTSTVYQASWPYNFGMCPVLAGPPQQDIVLRREMLIVNGTPLTQVLSLSSLLPGTFFVDTSHSLVYMYPPAGTNVGTATVETATRSSVWDIFGASNVVVRGLTFQYANSCPQNGAVSVGENATNVLFDSDSFVWNNAMGIFLNTVQNYTVQNSTANYNGQVGFGSHMGKNSLWQNDAINYNNWRGAQGAFYAWDRAGAKWMLDHSGTYTSITSNFNQGHGVFWDTDTENVTYTSGLSTMNLVNGMQIEKIQGPLAVVNSNICYANILGARQHGGVAMRNSEQVSLTGTALYGSLSDQFVIVGNPGGIQISNWETGQTYNLITSKFSATSNTVVGGSAAVFSDSYLGGSDWNTFVSTVKSNNNTYWSGAGNGFVVPQPRAGTDVNLSGWQNTTGQDKSSSWSSMGEPAACNVAAQAQDFWIISGSYNGAAISDGQAIINIATYGFGGISGNVSLSLDGISSVPGLKASLSSGSVPTTGNAVLTLTTSPSTPHGTYPITILGTLGNITHSVTVSLFVQ